MLGCCVCELVCGDVWCFMCHFVFVFFAWRVCVFICDSVCDVVWYLQLCVVVLGVICCCDRCV